MAGISVPQYEIFKIGDCVSKMPIDDLRPLGGLVKKYGYYGAFLAIQQSIEQRDLGSVCFIVLLCVYEDPDRAPESRWIYLWN